VSKDEGISLGHNHEIEDEGKASDTKMLVISFAAMVVVGLGNKIFQKLQTIPMYNYPLFLNLLTTFMYIPVSFAYIIPMARAGKISKEQLDMPKKPFAIMGALDAVAGIMQIFAATYLDGSLLILLTQAAIPASMFISKYLLDAKYARYQYVGAVIVAVGLVVVLVPSWSGGDNSGVIVWSIVMILSTIPMCLSSVYKEISLGETELDPVFLNGWIAIFQFLLSIPLTLPSGYASDPQVPIEDQPGNIGDGFKCWIGISTIGRDDDKHADDDDFVTDDCYLYAPLYVNIYLAFNIAYNILIILILKYGSANILWLAMTIMVPLGNVAFSLPFMPQSTTLHATDIVGLIVIVGGLLLYRFGGAYFKGVEDEEEENGTSSDYKQPLLSDDEVQRALDVVNEDVDEEELGADGL
jgi:drug/metabolite transporter (DMT)-like permease